MLMLGGDDGMAFDKQAFADNIRGLRNKKRMTQEQVAKAIGRSKATVIGYENARSIPDYEDAWKLADLFEVSIGELGERDEREFMRM